MQENHRSHAGLIPAHAGKTARSSARATPAPAHPRSRGENSLSLVNDRSLSGSSPLTRGKLISTVVGVISGRLIPAHAGKTLIGVAADLAAQGSSPLTRGKHFLTCVFIAQIGQILESLELCASSESYSSQDAYATGAPQDRVRSIGLVPRSSRDAS